MQFINTTNYTKDKKIQLGECCKGIIAVMDTIFLGGVGKVIILNADGSRVRDVTTGDCYIYNQL
jgi:hypothetical protein